MRSRTFKVAAVFIEVICVVVLGAVDLTDAAAMRKIAFNATFHGTPSSLLGRTPPSLNNERTDRRVVFISNTANLDAESIQKATGASHVGHKERFAFLTMPTAAKATALVKQGRVSIQRASCHVAYAHRPDWRTGPIHRERQDRAHRRKHTQVSP